MTQKTNEELVNILTSSATDSIKQAALDQLLKQSPSNSNLVYILEYCPADAIKQAAGDQLRANLEINERVDEEALIKEIAENVLARPGLLRMGSWHCGTSHCLAGWATVINPTALAIQEKIGGDWGTEVAGCAVLPNYAKYFRWSDDETVLSILKSKIAQ